MAAQAHGLFINGYFIGKYRRLGKDADSSMPDEPRISLSLPRSLSRYCSTVTGEFFSITETYFSIFSSFERTSAFSFFALNDTHAIKVAQRLLGNSAHTFPNSVRIKLFFSTDSTSGRRLTPMTLASFARPYLSAIVLSASRYPLKAAR